jgi:hypothetical protein
VADASLRDTPGRMSVDPETSHLAERVRALLEIGDRGEWDEAMTFFSPDAVWVAIDALEAFEGPAIRDFWVEWYQAYTDVQIEALEILEMGGGVVMAVIGQSGRLGDGLSRITQEAVLVYEWSGGLIERVTTYSERDEARGVAERLAAKRASRG